MTPREQAAFNAGIEAIRQAALTAAITIEVRDDAQEVRQRAAVAALQGLAEGATELLLGKPTDPFLQAFAIIANEPDAEGIITCPECSGRLRWIRASLNQHVHGQCETEGCLSWMQ